MLYVTSANHVCGVQLPLKLAWYCCTAYLNGLHQPLASLYLSIVVVAAAIVACAFHRVYFTAAASHLSHLARKFEAAVDEAMALSPSARHHMTAEALGKRFLVPTMMQQYAHTWTKVTCIGITVGSQKVCRCLQSRSDAYRGTLADQQCCKAQLGMDAPASSASVQLTHTHIKSGKHHAATYSKHASK